MLNLIREAVLSGGLLDELNICCESDLTGNASVSETSRSEVCRYVDGGGLDEVRFSVAVRLPFDRTPGQCRNNYLYMADLADRIAALYPQIGAELITVTEPCVLVRAGSAYAFYRCSFRMVCSAGLSREERENNYEQIG